MLDLQTHKDYLWKYLLTYGKPKHKCDDFQTQVFPFANIVMEDGKTVEDYRSEEIKHELDACATLEDVFDFVSLEYKDYYFMEISSLLHDDVETYSLLLKKTMDSVGITDYITAHNYQYLMKFADEKTQAYIASKL